MCDSRTELGFEGRRVLDAVMGLTESVCDLAGQSRDVKAEL